MKKIGFTIVMLFSITSLTGCWSAKELNELAIVTGLGIDALEEGEGYRVTVQMVNPGEVASNAISTRTAVSIYSEEGRSIFEALRKVISESPRKLYLAHLRVVIFGNELARKGIRKPLDFLSRDHEMRTDFFLLVARNNTAENILKVLTPMEKIPANKIFSSLETAHRSWAPVKTVTLDELIASLVSEGKQPVISGIRVIGSPEEGTNLTNVEEVDSPATLKVETLSVFKGDKLVEWLNQDESKGFNYITDNIKNTVGYATCEDGGIITAEVIRSKTEMKGSVQHGKPKIHIKVESEANIADVECSIDLSKPKNITKIEKKYEEKLKMIIMESVNKAQELETDIFGFGEEINRATPNQWEELKKNWGEHFATLDVQVEADLQIRRTGTISKTFQKDIKKQMEKEE